MLYDKERAKNNRKWFSENKNWIVVGAVALIILVLIPLLGSYASGKTAFPTTTIGWILYFTCAISTAVACMFLYLALHNQGKINVQYEEEYTKAKDLHLKNFQRLNKGKSIIPIDPFEWERKQKIKKGIFQFIGLSAGLVGLGAATLTYNYSQLISGAVSLLMSIIMGLVHMADVEKMFTEGWLEYELYIEQKLNEEEKNKELEIEFLEGVINNDSN